jgi:hypothetical protein
MTQTVVRRSRTLLILERVFKARAESMVVSRKGNRVLLLSTKPVVQQTINTQERERPRRRYGDTRIVGHSDLDVLPDRGDRIRARSQPMIPEYVRVLATDIAWRGVLAYEKPGWLEEYV